MANYQYQRTRMENKQWKSRMGHGKFHDQDLDHECDRPKATRQCAVGRLSIRDVGEHSEEILRSECP